MLNPFGEHEVKSHSWFKFFTCHLINDSKVRLLQRYSIKDTYDILKKMYNKDEELEVADTLSKS
jgi:hypothetical protein